MTTTALALSTRPGTGPAKDRPPLTLVHSHLREALAATNGIETRPFESEQPERLLGALVPAAVTAIDRSLAALATSVGRYEADAAPGAIPEITPAPSGDAQFYADIEQVMRSQTAADRICDLCLVARIELKGKRQQLLALGASESTWNIISACASARRKLVKSLSAVDAAIGEHEQSTGAFAGLYETELERSLLVRRAYTAFRKAICAEGTPRPEDVQKALRRAAVSIAVLVGRDVYEDLRVDDRMQLRQMQARVIEWLGTPDANPRHGLKLWHDLFAFTGLLVLVNNRAELRDHDCRVARELLGEFAPLAAAQPVDPILSGALAPLLGRDEVLDEAIKQRAVRTVGEVRAQLAQLLESLSGTTAAPSLSETGQASGAAF